MSLALVAQNKTKISFFLGAISFYVVGMSRKHFLGALPPIPTRALLWNHLWAYSASQMPSCI